MNNYKKFNFVLFLPPVDYYRVIFSDVHNCLNVRVVELAFQGITSRRELVVNCNPFKLSYNPHAFKKPLNSLQIEDYFNNEFSMNEPIVFLVFAEFYPWLAQANYFNYLKTCYPDCKLLLYLTNPVHIYQKNAGMFANAESYQRIHSTFDAVITYNPTDAVNFGLVHYAGLYSVLPLEKQPETFDIFFIGAAKDRLPKIINVYKQLKASGFKCDFHITDVPEELQELPQEIHYNKRLSYFEVLDHVMQSSGILEIAHGGNSGLTLRFFEALVYDKNFVTDNTFLHNSEFRSFKKVFPIKNTPKLNLDLNEYRAAAKLVNNYRNEYSPVRFIAFLEALLNQI